MAHFADRLCEVVRARGSAVCVGLDPRVESLPDELRRLPPAAAFEAFGRGLIEAVAAEAAGVKVQVAFYEALGPAGMEAYARTLRAAREHGLVAIGDVKRGDIGSTAEAYARAHLWPDAPFEADAVTINPLFGTDALQPFLDAAARHGKGVFLLVRTSNPSSSEVLEASVDGAPLFRRIAALVDRWGAPLVGASGFSSVGAVVGATFPDQLRELRAALPRTPLLVPGVGRQGGTARDAAGAFAPGGLGALVSSSREIIFAHERDRASGWRDAARDAARRLKEELREAAP